jgi:uncharacterized protein YegP (UPF0339 family)
MADESKNISVINKNDSGFPAYLDFDKLRAEGISYLGDLSGKIWTDHNAHDPGITILEVLCYALLDLGYRTNLPAADIFTRNTSDTSKDNNFFTPAQILACNPLTIIDYRKLLIDIEGVKNAWLEVARDQKDLCRRPRATTEPQVYYDAAGLPISHGEMQYDGDLAEEYLNGIYHVYIEPEKNIDTDFKNAEEGEAYFEDLKCRIKKALMSHRNLCEDFADIYILCKLKTGVCADIELEQGADAERAYLSIVEKLREFFSPSPQFYTLQQMLDQDKPIEEIFSGRPYNILESHGFTDAGELQQIQLKKEIHLSDVYSALAEVEGVKKVERVKLKACGSSDDGGSAKWKFLLPENHTADFSPECSSFNFSVNGISLPFDAKKYEGLLSGNFSHNGKLLYQAPSPYLDSVIPQGNYRSDLDKYFSIQNDFPAVYGIEEGGLPENASNERKAQALQLKGYLLFFDQLLCNYLAQVKNIRTLFSMSTADADLQHTYFFNKPDSVSGLNTLLRFPADGGTDSTFGSKGDTLLYPVSRKSIEDFLAQSPLPVFDPAAFEPYALNSMTDLNIALSAIKDSFGNGNVATSYLNDGTNKIYYYLTTTSEEIVLVSKASFKTKTEATTAMAGVTYMAGFDENYKSFITPAGDVSFFVESGMVSYEEYLQRIVESKELYAQRRNGFLDHLLSRFAVKFTDYALLSYGSIAAEQAAVAEIKAKEAYLGHYDEISSNRGKAYDYLESDLPENISGFEREVKYLSGIEVKEQHHLCNFIIDAYDEQFLVNLHIANHAFFAPEQKYNSRTDAQEAAQQLFNALSDKASYSKSYDKYTQQHSIYVNAGEDNTALLAQQYSSDAQADAAIESLTGMFSTTPRSEDVFVSKYLQQLVLSDHAGNIIHRSADLFETEAEAKSSIKKLAAQVNTPAKWHAAGEVQSNIGTLLINNKTEAGTRLLDIDAFKIDINDTIVGKPDKFTYDVLDRENSFKLHPAGEFDNKKDAEAHCRKMLLLAADKGSYKIEKDEAKNNYKVFVAGADQNEAACYEAFSTEEEAQAILDKLHGLIHQHEYVVSTEAIPSRHKFNYHLGYKEDERFLFTSNTDYATVDEALQAATTFNKSIPQLRLHQSSKKWLLSPIKANAVTNVTLAEKENAEHNLTAVQSLFELQKGIAKQLQSNKPEAFNYAVSVDESNGPGRFVYRLVDKDNVPAYYTETFPDKGRADEARSNVAAHMRQQGGYLQICLGGSDVVHKRENSITREVTYHYAIKDRNESYQSGDNAGEEIVLLESVQGYETATLAEQAFTENYLSILSLASDDKNYGMLISLTEPADKKTASQSIAFVPSQTTDEIVNVIKASVIEWIRKRAASYPIKMIEYGSEEFNKLFCKNEKKPKGACCNKEKDNYKYYFESPQRKEGEGQWRSTKYYDTPEDAAKDFLYFLVLLKFQGNLFIDCDNCSANRAGTFKIYIREVLAESAVRFENRDPLIAWGSEGVEKLICAVQSDAFRYYQRKEDCSYTFDVNCGEDFIIHPCKYDTAQKRTEALHLLHRQLLQSIEKRSFSTETEAENTFLLNIDGQRFAIRSNRATQNGNECEDRIKLAEEILSNDNIREEKGILLLLDKDQNVIVRSLDLTQAAAEWKATLNAFACHSPVVRSTDKAGNDKYCIEIKLPSFTDCTEEDNDDPNCGCTPVKDSEEVMCGIAWKTTCCFSDLNCAAVWQMYQYMLERLRDLASYRPVFDCTCNSFGIAIDLGIGRVPYNKDMRYLGAAGGAFSGRIVAFNPQHYPTPDMACRAAKRAKDLVNAEGLYVAEHILLRPKSEEDCKCRTDAGRDVCKCEDYKWKFPNTDSCNIIKDAWFIPGADPYSFIATVALPAWPKRFSTPEGKAAMENILYRSAPAHVMLRILWLAPYDLCRFETKYRSLRRLLAHKKSCIGDFNLCDFFTFLLHEEFQPVEPCRDCLPCAQKDVPAANCFEREDKNSQIQNKYTFPQEVDAFFKRELIDCGKYSKDKVHEIKEIVAEDKKNVALPVKPVPEKAKVVSNDAVKAIKKEKAAPVAQPATVASFVNRRIAAYRDAAAGIREKSKNNPLAVKAEAYLKDPSPAVSKTNDLITEIIQNKKPAGKGTAALTENQQDDLIQSIVCYRLDNICFKEKDAAQIKSMKEIFDKLLKAKVDSGAIYNHWNALDVKGYVPELNMKEAKKIITGK